MANLQDQRFKNLVTGNWEMIDHGGNHFVNSKCVNPKDVPQSVLNLKYTEVRDEDGNVVSYKATNKREATVIGTTYPRIKDVEFFKVLGHIPLEQRGTDKYGQPKMYVKRGFEHLIN